MPAETRQSRDGWGIWLIVLLTSIGLTLLFWDRLWSGGTLIGGDTISYYYPQKMFLADSLQRGEIPLWNPLVGAGYPVAAESQTGVLYPPTLLFYRFLSVSTAYSAIQILHYVIAFLGIWALSRQYGISRLGSFIAGLIYVYGWFPSRICLEWAIIGGAYLPWLALITERWLTTRRTQTLLGLAPCFGLMLLAGHFHLAFIATVGLCTYLFLRLWREHDQASTTSPRDNLQLGLTFGVVLAGGYLLASAQLLPTLELMQRSQRQEFNQGNDPGYGHIPPWYLSQVLSLWMWYGPDMDPDQTLFQVGSYAYPVNTNKVEAHLYFGMLPLGLIAFCLIRGIYLREWLWSREIRLWLIVGLIGLGLAIGWPYVVLKHLPGFGYFRGAGRNSVLTALAVALAAGQGWDRFRDRMLPTTQVLVIAWMVVTGLTTWELWTVSRWVTYAVMLRGPLLHEREESVLRQDLLRADRPVRLWAPGSNAATLLGFSCYPVYLGLGPQEYFDPRLASSYHDETDRNDQTAVDRHVEWLRRNGVTHILSFDPLNSDLWPVRLMRADLDRLLSTAWARVDSPLLLYELLDAPGRVVRDDGQPVPVTDFQETANRLSMSVDLPQPATIELRELEYPGWNVTIDGKPAIQTSGKSIYRQVEVPAGNHHLEWVYRPKSLWIGMGLSVLSLLTWLSVWWRMRGTDSSLPSPNSTR